MRNAKTNQVRSTATSLSVADVRLKRYLDPSAEIKRLETERDQIKEEIKHSGTHSTRHYVVTVDERNRTLAPTTEVLEAEFGPSVRRLFKTISYLQISVKAKGGPA